MAKSTKTLSGQSQKKFFRELFRADPGVAPEAAERLTEACAEEISLIRVRLPLVKHRAVAGADKAMTETVQAVGTVSEAFDPNSFSLIVMLRKQGREALFSTLEAIGDADRLRAIAKAQHVAVEPGLSDVAALAEAIVAGTEKRVANRQAAAS